MTKQKVGLACLALSLAVCFSNCKKEQAINTSDSSLDEQDKIKRFISISFGITDAKLFFDPNKNVYQATDYNFSIPLDSAKHLYQDANEYKAVYEK